MLRSVTLAIALILSTAAMAQTQVGPHSEKDEDACDRDAHRFCKDAIPDQMRVLEIGRASCRERVLVAV